MSQKLTKQFSVTENNLSTNRSSINLNTYTIRRHTSRKFKHGKTARVLGIATIVLAFTWLPYWYHNIIFLFVISPYKSSSASLRIIWETFLKNSFYLNYIINPIIYSFVDQRFRQNVIGLFKQAFSCLFKKEQNVELSSLSQYPAHRNHSVKIKNRDIKEIKDDSIDCLSNKIKTISSYCSSTQPKK